MSISTPTKPVSVMTRIEDRQAALGLSDQELCAAVGFDREIVLTLIRTGIMRLPLTKVPAFAEALSLDACELFKAALHENSPELASLIETIYNPMQLTPIEKHLIECTRTPVQALPAAPLTHVATLGAAA
jgi:hypothetical protein